MSARFHGILVSQLETAFVQASRYSGAFKHLFQQPEVQKKLDDSLGGLLFHSYLADFLDGGVLFLARVTERGGLLHALSCISNDNLDLNGRKLRDQAARILKEPAVPKVRVHRTEVLAHDLWRVGSKDRNNYVSIYGSYEAPSYDNCLELLIRSAEVTGGFLAIAGNGDGTGNLTAEYQISRYYQASQKMWSALPVFSEVEVE